MGLTTLAVHVDSEADIRQILNHKEISHIHVDKSNNLVTVEGAVAPSQLVELVKATGRDVFVRGSGDPNSAAVCILESSKVNGLVRIIQNQQLLFDISLNGLSRCKYAVNLRQLGDISQGIASAGPVLHRLGEFVTDKSGKGGLIVERDVDISGIIGRSISVESIDGSDLMIGVIARSAGAWENTKVVCSCSGRTLWDERQEQLARGMM